MYAQLGEPVLAGLERDLDVTPPLYLQDPTETERAAVLCGLHSSLQVSQQRVCGVLVNRDGNPES